MADLAKKKIEIFTGRYGKGTPEENQIVELILGGVETEQRFGIYFHWYNVIHELGHGIRYFANEEYRQLSDDFESIEPANLGNIFINEEQLVNDFAVAFWRYYGESDKLEQLKIIVNDALTRFERPTDSETTHIDYALANFHTEEFQTFNNYGWFQMSCVAESLRKNEDLASVLERMGVDIKVQPQKLLTYPTITEVVVPEILDTAVALLREWGALLPTKIVNHLENDPNRNMCWVTDNEEN